MALLDDLVPGEEFRYTIKIALNGTEAILGYNVVPALVIEKYWHSRPLIVVIDGLKVFDQVIAGDSELPDAE